MVHVYLWPTSAQSWPNSVPNFSDSGQTLVEPGRSRASFARSRASFVEIRSTSMDSGPNRLMIWAPLARVAPLSAPSPHDLAPLEDSLHEDGQGRGRKPPVVPSWPFFERASGLPCDRKVCSEPCHLEVHSRRQSIMRTVPCGSRCDPMVEAYNHGACFGQLC